MRWLKNEILNDPKEIHRLIYVFFLIGIVASMPLSKYVTSVFQFLLLIHWLVRGDLRGKWDRFKSNRALWIFLLFFIVPVLGMIYTSDWDYGLHDLKIKLPLLALPLIIGTSEVITRQQLKLILLTFTASVTISSLVSLGILTGLIPYSYADIRETSLFISHIRFALLVAMSVFILSFYALRPGTRNMERAGLFFWAFYLVAFLLASKALTGIVVVLLAGLVLSVRWLLNQRDFMLRWFVLVAVVTVPVLVAGYLSRQVKDFYTLRDDVQNLDRQTINGNPYWHDTTNLQLENGHYTGLYWCEEEMRGAWNGISSIDYGGKDHKGHELRHTLIRYLTSMGLRKDSFGVSQLGKEDIDLIESGYANHIYKKKNRFSVRIYELIWEIDVYRKGGNPSGHSVTQRIEYLKAGFSIWSEHPVLGVGTGDVPAAFEEMYERKGSRLDPWWRLRAHNQWLTFAVSFGIAGALLLLAAFILPGIIRRKFNQYLFVLFFIVSFLSMFNEDTLETQAGVAFFAFFYPFLLFSPDHETSTDD